jgi:glycosyltransferase involved in cell wall biosynthesis
VDDAELDTSVELPVLRGPGGRPLRIAHLTTVDMSLELLLGVELDVDVATGLDVVGLSAPGPYVAAVEARGVRHVPLPSLTRSWDPRSDAAAARELLQALLELRLDVLHTHNPKTGVLGRVLGRLVGVPVVVNTCHGLWAQAHDSLARRTFVLGAESFAAQFSHAELAQNAEDAATLRRWGAPQPRVVGNGTDLRRFGPDPVARARLRAEWGIEHDTLVVGGVGRLVAEKGLVELAAAARTLHDRFDDQVTVVWVGPDDPDKPDALSDLAESVRLLGARTDMPAVYNAFDVFVLPSYREGFSRSGMEAAATGLPLVLSDIRGCREVGRHEREALLVAAGDEAALAEAILRLVEDPELRERLGTAARKRALAEFDQVRIAASSLATYLAVANRRRLRWGSSYVDDAALSG